MRIGVNLESLYPGKIGGAEQYVRNVLQHLSNMADTELYVFVNSTAFPTFKDQLNMTHYLINGDESVDGQLNFYIDMLNLEIMFCPLFHIAPKHCPIPVVVSVLDIQQDYFPEYFSPAVLKERKELTYYTLNNADAIITISEFSKSTILDKYAIAPEKISVTYLNSDASFDVPLTETRLQEIHNYFESDYIFYPANSWPHKNHLALLKAYVIMKEKYHTTLKLVFTGDAKQKGDEINHFIKENHLENDVIYLGYIRQENMPYIYANATVLVFPSLFEGFGIPLVEAMRAKVAIACSNTTSIPEIVGTAALQFDPLAPNDIAEKLYELERNPKLRDELIERGKLEAERFSWANCAKQTYEILMKTLVTCNAIKSSSDLYKYSSLPLVSIITPSYNQGAFIRQTIESVLNQDYPRIEYIVIDGGSTDNTVDILKEYRDRIIWISERDEGQADAVNKGIGMAHGEIIGWLNSDDTYLPGAVSKAVDYLTGHVQISAVYGEGYYTDINGNITERYLTEKFDRDRLAEVCFICQPTLFFNAEAVKKVGYLNKSLHLCMDYELWIRMSKNNRIAYIPEYMATSRMYDENKTLSRRNEVYEEICSVVRQNYKYVPDDWLIGYADWKCHGSRGIKFKATYLQLLFKYNLNNNAYLREKLWEITKQRLGKKQKFTGKYDDNWLALSYRTILEASKNSEILFLEGEHLWPMEEPLEISILLQNKLVSQITIAEKGSFSKHIKLKKPLPSGEYSLKLICNQTFCPANMGFSNDKRDLSFILKNICLKGEL